MRSLGRFVGEISKAVAPSKRPVEVSRTTETETRETDLGTVTVRRTTIEEIEVQQASTPKPG